MKNSIKYVVGIIAAAMILGGIGLVFMMSRGSDGESGQTATAGATFTGEVVAVEPTAVQEIATAPEEKPTPAPTPTPASTEVKVGNQMKTIYEVKGTFKTNKHKLVFKTSTGGAFRGGFFLSGKHVYFARKDGEIARGWLKYRGNVYYFTREKGMLTSKTQIEGVKLSKNGIAKPGKQNEQRVATYLKAANTLRRITRLSDSKSKKLYKCYQWVMGHTYVRHRKMRDMMKQANWKETWDIVFANDIFEKHSGCCVSYAASFALLARECGYKKVTLCCDTGHAWDDIAGRLYDPLFAKSRSFKKNYNAHYTDYRSYAAIKKKIS